MNFFYFTSQKIICTWHVVTLNISICNVTDTYTGYINCLKNMNIHRFTDVLLTLSWMEKKSTNDFMKFNEEDLI